MWESSIVPNCPAWSLVGIVGNSDGEAICLKSSYSGQAPNDGELKLAFNDGVSFDDNIGGWVVRVSY